MYATLSDRADSRIYPRVSAFFARNNTLGRFSFGETIPDPFPVGDYPSRPGLLDDVELKERLRRLQLEEENKRSNDLSAAHRQRILSYNA